jgi:N-acetylmuramoyl-L-alanine amidase
MIISTTKLYQALIILALCLINATQLYAKNSAQENVKPDEKLKISTKSLISKIEFLPEQKVKIHLDKKTQYKIYTINQPYQIVIEIANAQFSQKPSIGSNPNFIKEVLFENNDKNFKFFLLPSQKFLTKNLNFENKNNVISFDLISEKSTTQPASATPPQAAQNIDKHQSEIDKLIEKNIDLGAKNLPIKNLDNAATKTPKIVAPVVAPIAEKTAAPTTQSSEIIKKTSASIAKYKVRQSTQNQNKNPQNFIEKIAEKPIIVIDAGHGGKDPGAIGVFARTKEKNITLAFAKELAKNLAKEKKYRIFLTRDNDYFIPLGKRVQRSRHKKADLFISLHANSGNDKSVSGFSIYTLSEKSSDKQAELLAQKENQADIINGIDFSGASREITKTLIDLSQRESKNSSADFANLVINQMKETGVEVLQNTHRFAGFMVLTAPDMASTLIELGYLSNRREEAMLNDISYRKLIVKNIVNSINLYFDKK